MLRAIKWNSYFSLESSGRMVPDSRRDRRNPAFCFLAWFNILFSCSSVLPHGPLPGTKVDALFFDSWLFTFNTWGLFPLLGASVRVKFKDVQTGVGFQQAVEGVFFPVTSDVTEVLIELNLLHLEQGSNHRRWPACCPTDYGTGPK